MRFYGNNSQVHDSYAYSQQNGYSYPYSHNESSFNVSNGDISIPKGHQYTHHYKNTLHQAVDSDQNDSNNVVEINLDTHEKQKLLRQDAEIEDKKKMVAEM